MDTPGLGTLNSNKAGGMTAPEANGLRVRPFLCQGGCRTRGRSPGYFLTEVLQQASKGKKIG
jgi:hypothetical protein